MFLSRGAISDWPFNARSVGAWRIALWQEAFSLPTVSFLGSIVRMKLLLDRVVYHVVCYLDQAQDFLCYLPSL